MIYREFGRTGIQVSEIGVGCGGLGGERKLGLEPVVERAIELGINFFDTCDTYAESRSEQTLGRVFKNVPRDKIVLCTKFGGCIDKDGNWYRDISVKHLGEAFDASCRRLGMDYFDIYLVHTPPRDICTHSDLFAALEKMVEQGKIRAFGLSVETGDFATEFVNARTGAPQITQITRIKNMKNQSAESVESVGNHSAGSVGKPGLAIEIAFSLFAQDPRNAFLKVAEEKGVGVICKSPMASGTLAGSLVVDGPPPASDPRLQNWGSERYAKRAEMVRKVRAILAGIPGGTGFKPVPTSQLPAPANGRTLGQGALAWLLSFPQVSTVIPGISSMARLEETAAAAGMRLTPAELAALDAIDGGALVGKRVE